MPLHTPYDGCNPSVNFAHNNSVGNWNSHTLLLEMSNGTAALENGLAVTQKVKQLPHNPAIPFQGINQKELKTCPQKKLIHTYSHYFLEPKVETTQMSTIEELRKKMWS